MDTIGAISYVHEVKEHAHLRKWSLKALSCSLYA